jgi:hypothetical protein
MRGIFLGCSEISRWVCSIAIHEYQALQLPISVVVITRHLDEFLDYSRCVLLKDAQQD